MSDSFDLSLYTPCNSLYIVGATVTAANDSDQMSSKVQSVCALVVVHSTYKIFLLVLGMCSSHFPKSLPHPIFRAAAQFERHPTKFYEKKSAARSIINYSTIGKDMEAYMHQ
jgi:hypothetical protein